jgi:Exonuclease III
MMQEIKTQDETFPYDDFSALDYESHVFGQKVIMVLLLYPT